MTYDSQLWVIPAREHKIKQMLEHFMPMYPDIEVLSLEEVEKQFKKRK